MDPRLAERLKKLHEQIQAVNDAQVPYDQLEGSSKSMLAELTLNAEGKSMSERETRALASPEWKTFAAGLAAAHSRLSHERRLLTLQEKAYDAEHVTYKIENSGINRSGA